MNRRIKWRKDEERERMETEQKNKTRMRKKMKTGKRRMSRNAWKEEKERRTKRREK